MRREGCWGRGRVQTPALVLNHIYFSAPAFADRSSDEAGGLLGEGLGLDTAPPGASFGAAWAAMEQHTGMGRYRIAGGAGVPLRQNWCGWNLRRLGRCRQHTGMGRHRIAGERALARRSAALQTTLHDMTVTFTMLPWPCTLVNPRSTSFIFCTPCRPGLWPAAQPPVRALLWRGPAPGQHAGVRMFVFEKWRFPAVGNVCATLAGTCAWSTCRGEPVCPAQEMEAFLLLDHGLSKFNARCCFCLSAAAASMPS